jgi:hypothetical protein
VIDVRDVGKRVGERELQSLDLQVHAERPCRGSSAGGIQSV